MNLDLSLEIIGQQVKAVSIQGATANLVTGIASLSEAQVGDLSFLGNTKYQSLVPACEASVILVPLDYEGLPRANQAFVRVNNPSEALGLICEAVAERLFPKPISGVHPSAVIHASAKIDKTAMIGPLCVIEEGAVIEAGAVLVAHVYVGRFAKIGEGCHLRPHVSIMEYCQLGKHVQLHSGVVIGSDGFGYSTVKGVHHKEAQVGIVVVEDEVEVGSNTTIDRARFAKTLIGRGTKIDNLVQIAHNVQVGPHCILVSQSGIAGSTQLGSHVILGGQAGLAGHLTIGDGSMIGGQGGVINSLPAKSYVRGTPCMPINQEMRLHVLYKRLPDLNARVTELEKRLPAQKNPCADLQV